MRSIDTDDAAVGPAEASAKAFLFGGGQLGDLIAAFDWSATALGPIRDWDTTLKAVVSLILQSPTPIVTLWGDMGTMIYNDGYAAFAGSRHPEQLGMPVREAWPEAAEFNDNVMKCGLSGKTLSYVDFELTLTRSQGPKQAWLNLDYSPIRDERGTPVAVMAVVVETTDRVLAAQRLLENEARLKFLDALGKETAKSTDADTILSVTTRMVGEHLGVTSCAYADMDPDQDGFTIRGDWAAPGAVHIVGHYSLADFGKLAVQNLGSGRPLIVNDNLAELAPEEAATFQNIGIGATICMPLIKEGRLTALMAIHHQRPHIWTENELALITEVTERSWAHIERVRSEADARASERRFRGELERKVIERTAELQKSEKTIRTVFETSYMTQGLLTTDGKVVYVNTTALTSIDGRLEDVIGRKYWETPWFTNTPGMPERVKEAVERVSKGESIQFVMPLNMPKEQRLYEFSMRPAIDESGEVVALVPEAIDITVRARAEQALHQAQKMEAIGSLTGGVAHDFNNLLMAVMGSLDLLRKRIPPDPKLLRLVDNAAEGARRGKSLTERMLAFARRQHLNPKRIGLKPLIDGMTELLERSLGPTIIVDVDVPDTLPHVEIDPNQLESAVLNLAVNARDAMSGQGLLRISAREGVPPSSDSRSFVGRYVCLCVEDEGEGMDEGTLRRAIEPFFTTKGVGKGTGLGLSMVQGLAEQSGGTLTLRSELGSGTTVEIWLPAVAAESRDARVPSLPIPPGPELERTRLKVLVVDDDPLVLAHTAALLEDLGHVAVPVASGPMALAELSASRFDVMVTDHAMPHMTGVQLLQKTSIAYPEMSSILASGFAELPSDSIAAKHLQKPYSQAALAEALVEVIRAAPRTVSEGLGISRSRAES